MQNSPKKVSGTQTPEIHILEIRPSVHTGEVTRLSDLLGERDLQFLQQLGQPKGQQ